MASAIKVEGLSKQYRLGQIGTGSIAHDVNRWWHKIRGKENPYLKIGEENDRTKRGISEYVWSLKDINFEIEKGDAVGIIGRNGAGKSTLLKILSRVSAPTLGSFKAKGRIASLLEVGTGFHPELSGRENVFLNGAILGMRKKEIERKFDEIVDFAGVERYIDTPVKRYSSGMYVRLAFAVAAHLESEILIVDEVLAVGDAEFQKKCLGKMGQVSKGEGRTVVFVSHDMHAVNTLTNHCLYLSLGKLVEYGSTYEVINTYLNARNKSDLVYTSLPLEAAVKITRVELITSMANNVHINGEDLMLKVEVSVPKEIRSAWIAIQICDSHERNFVHVWTNNNEQPLFNAPGTYQIICNLPKCQLYMGKYVCNVYISEPPGGEIFESLLNVCPFEVVMYNLYREYPWRNDECAFIADNVWEVKWDKHVIIE